MREVLSLAVVVLGKSLPWDLASLEQVLESTRRGSGGGNPSMAADWEQGRQLETEVILGDAVKLAMERGVKVGRLQAMHSMLKVAQETRDVGGRGVSRL